MKAVLGRVVVMVASFPSGLGGRRTWLLYESGVSLRAASSAARSRLVPPGAAAHGYGCRCEGHGGVAPSPASPGLQPAAGFAAVSPAGQFDGSSWVSLPTGALGLTATVPCPD